MSIGYIKFYRCITEHWIYPNHRKLTPFEVWVDLLMMANYEDKKAVMDGKPVDVKRGQILRSQKNLALRWMWGDKEARNFLKTLQKDKMILLQPCKKWTLITICNYDTYQDSGNAEATQKKRKGKPEEIQRTTFKEDKEDKEVYPHAFEKSEYYDPKKFKEELEGWSIGQLRFYYDALSDYSKQGNKYKDWIATARTWARKDEAEGKGFFHKSKKGNPNATLGLADGGIV